MVEIAGFRLGLERDERYYTREENTETYEEKRYGSRGGQYIDRRNKEWVREFFEEQGLEWAGERPLEDKEVLVSAGGTGRIARYLEGAGADVTCLDLSREMLSEGRGKGEGTISYVQGDARDLPFEDDSFDYVVSMRSAHVIQEGLKDYMEEMGRVSEEGVLMDTFSTPSLRSIYNPLLTMDSTLYSDVEVESLVEDSEVVDIDSKNEEFVLPYAAFLISGNISVFDPLVEPLASLNRMLESRDLTDRFSSVTVWELDPVD
ncbi:MAG: class I SAM-dependent methyltransferase [Candidatus Nanohaloarchaea archaeon]|nr:class I SAM-dependent methyltransferase [Candidatus Nanohaloarchaea archaeon]